MKYQIGDTIAAVSSPTMDGKVIVRLSGDHAFRAVLQLLLPQKQIPADGIIDVQIRIDSQLKIDAAIYCFCSPHSYTGEDVVEIHFYSNHIITEKLMDALFNASIRQAEPGEFTARSFFNGKIDLSQAEAVNRIITGSNRFQIDSAQRLLSGRLSQIIENAGNELLRCLSLLEAGLDFSDQDIEIISPRQAIERLKSAKESLDDLLAGAVSCEITTALPSVGIAGAPNAGKSRLFNALLGKKRSIVSRKKKPPVMSLQASLPQARADAFFSIVQALLKNRQILLTNYRRQQRLKRCTIVIRLFFAWMPRKNPKALMKICK